MTINLDVLSVAALLASVTALLAMFGFWIRLEHRLTRLETRMDNFSCQAHHKAGKISEP